MKHSLGGKTWLCYPKMREFYPRTKSPPSKCLDFSGTPRGGSSSEESVCQCRRQERGGFNPWVGKIPWKRFQYFCLENPMDRETWWAALGLQRLKHDWMNEPKHIPRNKASSLKMSRFVRNPNGTYLLAPSFAALEKEMATHSSILAWEIPRTEEPGGLQSMESPRVRYDLATK